MQNEPRILTAPITSNGHPSCSPGQKLVVDYPLTCDPRHVSRSNSQGVGRGTRPRCVVRPTLGCASVSLNPAVVNDETLPDGHGDAPDQFSQNAEFQGDDVTLSTPVAAAPVSQSSANFGLVETEFAFSGSPQQSSSSAEREFFSVVVL